ncbi:hypothetical protein HD554DRAFT_2040707 [Boletus coccyginus]|nr:hypothetical protein HD554DRAFT_2040707 [Boletus coccyginus]
MPVRVPAISTATTAALTTTSHCARLTTGDWTCVNGAANAGTPAVNEGINAANENHFALVIPIAPCRLRRGPNLGFPGRRPFRPFCPMGNTSSTMYCRVLPRASGHRGRVFAGVVRPWEGVTRGDRGGHRGPSTGR